MSALAGSASAPGGKLSLVQFAQGSPPTVPDEAKLLELAGRYYPAIVHDERSTPDLVLGFLPARANEEDVGNRSGVRDC
jgi:hypothetical protein